MSLGGALVLAGMVLGGCYLWLVQVGWKLRAEQIQRDAESDRVERAELEAEYLARRDAAKRSTVDGLRD